MSINASVYAAGLRQQKAAQLRAELEAKVRQAKAETQEKLAAEAKVEEERRQLEGTGPVGQGEYLVEPGDCISSIAKDKGYFWETIWNDPANAELKAMRKDPNVLLPDDRVNLPPKGTKREPGETERRHRFVRRGEPMLFRIRVLQEGEPQIGAPFSVEVDQKVIVSGVIGPTGLVEFPLPGDAREGILRIGNGDDAVCHRLLFGAIDPIATLAGVQQRLFNLGYGCRISGVLDSPTRWALRRFQRSNALEQTGALDELTRERLQESYGG